MITKAIIKSINATGDRCIVRMPLFETSASSLPVEAEALVNISPGSYNNLEVNDIVFIAFEENAIEKPIILGKLFRGASIEGKIRGGGGVFDSLRVKSSVSLPSSTNYSFPQAVVNAYSNFSTPQNTADYIKWLESYTKGCLSLLDENFTCFRNWTQEQFQRQIDDGDLDDSTFIQESNQNYPRIDIDKKYPNT